MMKKDTKEGLELRKKQLEMEQKEVEEQLGYMKFPEQLKDMWKTQFGWPSISQELLLAQKLDKETYDKLYRRVEEVIEKIASMVPEYRKKSSPCKKCEAIRTIIIN